MGSRNNPAVQSSHNFSRGTFSMLCTGYPSGRLDMRGSLEGGCGMVDEIVPSSCSRHLERGRQQPGMTRRLKTVYHQ